MTDQVEEMLIPSEVAEKLKIGRSTVYHLASKGKLPAVKIGGALRFRPSALAKFIAELEKMSLGAAA